MVVVVVVVVEVVVVVVVVVNLENLSLYHTQTHNLEEIRGVKFVLQIEWTFVLGSLCIQSVRLYINTSIYVCLCVYAVHILHLHSLHVFTVYTSLKSIRLLYIYTIAQTPPNRW